MTRPHRVVHVLGDASREWTGIAAIVAELARGLDRERYSLEALFLGEDGPLVRRLEDVGVQCRVVRWRRGAGDVVGAIRFAAALRRRPVSLVHTHVGGRAVRRLARIATGGSLVAHVHSRLDGGSLRAPLDLSDADAVIAVSAAAGALVRGAPVEVIHSGVPLSLAAGPPDRAPSGSFVLGSAGRLVPLKGIADLLDAVARLRGSVPGLRLEVVGEGPERPALEARSRALGLDETVAFLGWRDEPRRLMPGWDVFVQPSREDAFGIAVVEAMAEALPVVATCVGGIPEVVIDGRTGCLVPPADPAALAEALAALAREPALRRALGDAGRERVRVTFSSEQMVSDVTRVYERLLAGPA